MTEHTPTPVLSVGLDYVTVTAKHGSRAAELLALGRALLRAEVERGNVERPFSGHGYQGVGAGQVTWATREADALLTASGKLAQEQGLSILHLGDHAARVDVQVTLQIEPEDIPRRIADARYRPLAAAAPGRPIVRRLLDDSRTGRTVYLGSPKSAAMGRIYDKGRESPDIYPPGSIRYEVQARREKADQWRQRAVNGRLDAVSVVGWVDRWFSDRGAPPWIPGAVRITDPRIRAPPADYERSLMWWRRCVAPSIRRFLTDATSAEIAAALGLSLTRTNSENNRPLHSNG